MDCFRALKLVESIEQLMADLYERFSTLFVADEDAAAFFYRMSRDELSHRNLVQFQQRLAKKNPREFGDVALDLDLFNATTEKVQYFMKRDSSPTLEEAVRIGIDFENDVAEHLYRTVIAEANPATQDLVKNLGRQSEIHRQHLVDFAVSRGFIAGWERTT
jgi:rubrerythrin